MKNKTLKKLIIFVSGLVIVVLIFGIWISSKINKPNSINSELKNFTITQGEGAGEIAKRLQKEGLIKSDFAFIFYLNYKGLGDRIQTGEYQIPQNMNIPQVADIISKGKVTSNKITIPEGWDNEKIGNYLEDKEISTKSEFINLAKADNYREKYSFLKELPQAASLEGYLYPDTYQISKNANANEVITKMLENFERKYQSVQSEIPGNKISLHELVTLASVVEREVSKADDRKMVASVFWNRLEIGMPLESCATIQYILKENKKQFTYEETRTVSEYNTYLNKGLPKGPIGNPSLDSIKAAANPPESDFLYFLSSNGITYFSKNLDEHNAKKEKYLR